VELAAGSGDALCELLVGSLGAIVEVTKFRTVYLYQNVRIHLDEVPNLGTFLEFEAIVDDGCDDTAAESKVRTLYAAFDLTDSQVCSDSYSDLLRRG
jgi:predicted adenylyl cyclase CyaB